MRRQQVDTPQPHRRSQSHRSHQRFTLPSIAFLSRERVTVSRRPPCRGRSFAQTHIALPTLITRQLHRADSSHTFLSSCDVAEGHQRPVYRVTTSNWRSSRETPTLKVKTHNRPPFTELTKGVGLLMRFAFEARECCHPDQLC